LETIENPPDREKLKERGKAFSIDEIGGKWLRLIKVITKPEVTESHAAI
jgi:hypothetical protein